MVVLACRIPALPVHHHYFSLGPLALCPSDDDDDDGEEEEEECAWCVSECAKLLFQ